MAKSDGTVYIDTKIDTSGFGKGMADARQKVSAFSGSLNKLGNTIKNTFSQSNTVNAGKNYDELRKEIAKTEIQLDKLIEKQIRFVETGGNIKSRTMAGMEYDIESARNRLEELQNQLSLASKETPKKVGKMNTWIERLKKSFDSLNKSSKRSHLSILRMLGTSILFSTVFRTISAVTKGFGEGINNLVQYSDKANVSMSALKSSLTQLKNSFATAFMPIITAVTPAVTQFISLISKATSVVAAFFSALTGNKTYTKAIEIQEDYAESLDKTSDSAKKAQKYLSGLDEIRTFTEKDGNASGTVLPENMFKEEKINSSILGFADKVNLVIKKIKTFIKDEDWEGLGSYISDGIVGALDYLSDEAEDFDWEGFGEDVGGFIKGIKWSEILKSVGKLIWDGINGGIDFWKGMFDTAPIETTIISGLAILKFTGLGNVLKNAFKTSMLGAFTSFGGLGGLLTTDLSTILGAGTLSEIGLAAGTAIIGGILAAIIGFNIGKEIGKVINPEGADFYENFKWLGKDGFFAQITEDWKVSLDALLDMLTDFENNPIIAALGQAIAGPFISAIANIKKAFEKIYPFLQEWFAKIKPWFTKEKWSEAMKGIKSAFENIWKGAVNIAIKLLNKFIDYINEKMHFEWEPFEVLGQEVIPGGSVQLFTIPKIPMLATGAVIPPNAPFMAMLGDQKHGTNIEAPLDTIKQAVREVVGNNGGGKYAFTAQINRRTLFEEIIDEAKLRQSTSGRNPFDLA